MKFKFLTPVFILGIALLINFASCKKETATPTTPTTEDLISVLDQTDKNYQKEHKKNRRKLVCDGSMYAHKMVQWL